MPLTVSCQTCARQLRVPEDAAGKAVRCPGCASSMVIPAPADGPPPPPALEGLSLDDAGDLPPPPPRPDRRRDDEAGARELPRRRRPPHANPGLLTTLRVVGMVAWGILLVMTAGGGLLFFVIIQKVDTAIQEAALGAVFSTGFIGLYIVVRCVEKLLFGIEHLQFHPTRAPGPADASGGPPAAD